MPVIAIFTKFDDLVAQVYDWDKEEDENRTEAEKVVKDKFKTPLKNTRDQPKEYVCFEGIFLLFSFQASFNKHFVSH